MLPTKAPGSPRRSPQGLDEIRTLSAPLASQPPFHVLIVNDAPDDRQTPSQYTPPFLGSAEHWNRKRNKRNRVENLGCEA